jgi:uncharacterized protein (TIGR02058 family)
LILEIPGPETALFQPMTDILEITNDTFFKGTDMTKTAYIMQMGMGSDLHGSDDTKAAVRAVNDAIQNNNMLFLRKLDLPDWSHLLVDVVIATPKPDKVDLDSVKKTLPIGTVMMTTQPGGMLVDSDDNEDPVLVALACVTISTKD